jgi:hypothetical protein
VGGELRMRNTNPGTLVEITIPAVVPMAHATLATA